MSRRNVSELHQIVLSISISSLNLCLKQNQQLYATAKVGQLITSKSVPLRFIRQNIFEAVAPLTLDLVVPYDKQTQTYENKEIKLIITDKTKKTVFAGTTANLSDHINLQSSQELGAQFFYRLRGCNDPHAQVSIAIEYKHLQLKMSSSSLRSNEHQERNLSHIDNSNIFRENSSEVVLEQSIVLQKSVIFERQNSKQNISPASPGLCNLSSPKNTLQRQQCLMSPDQKSIIENLSIISNECNVLYSMMKSDPNVQALREENAYLLETRQHMKNQIESLQYLNGILLEQESNKEREIEYLQKQLANAHILIDKWKESMELQTVQNLKNQVVWLREASEVADEELNRLKQQNESLIEQNKSSQIKQQNNVKSKQRNILNSFSQVNNHSLKLSLQFNKLKKAMIKGKNNEGKKDILCLMNPLQNVIQSVCSALRN